MSFIGGAGSEDDGEYYSEDDGELEDDDEDGFSVGCSACQSGDGFNVGGEYDDDDNYDEELIDNDGFNVGREADKTCKVTMIWADWCGYSKKAKPEWDNLVKEHHGKTEIDGYKLHLKDAEEKIDPETVKKYKPDGFPTYFVELSDKPGQKHDFNSIKKDDMFSKIKESISKLTGGSSGEGFNVGGQPAQPCPKCGQTPCVCNKAHPVPTRAPAPTIHKQTKVGKPTVHGEIHYANCNDSLQYGPTSLEFVDHNLTSVGSAPNVVGGIDCTDLDYAPVKFALGGSQVPNINNIPALAQLKAPDVGAVQGTIRPHSLQKTGSDKKANVTMVWADWCGYSNKAKPEWDKLKSEMNGKTVSGCKVDKRDLEHKKNEEEIKEKYSDVDGFPTYVVEVTDSSGKLIKKQSFNSIEKNDMQQKLETILSGN